MNAVVSAEWIDDEAGFFAPAPSDMITDLVGQYRGMRQRVDYVAGLFDGEMCNVVDYFIEGNRSGDGGRYSEITAAKIFQAPGAVAALNSAYWSKAMHLTDVLNYMPQARRDEWDKSIRDLTCPEFEDETVRGTLGGLLNMRSQFLAERVDGIFRGLSGEHVTNSPAAFGKRMIVSRVLNEYGSEDYSKCGLVNDLRCVIAKFMGRDEPGYNASAGLIRTLKGRWGEWVAVDGGAIKIRLYKKGTAYIEVHPDMAWRLNATLAALYPMAIPPEFRQKPKRRPKEVALIQRPLPFAVVELLAGMKPAVKVVATGDWRRPHRHDPIRNAMQFEFGGKDKHAFAEACRVLESIGGVKVDGYWQFDYHPDDILADIVASGCIPDDKAHQFYQTPASIAARVVELAEIGTNDTCLEPSAGAGGIADLMPKDRTRCVEVSRLRCDILTAKGFDLVACADFLEWSASARLQSYDRICMNPPFDRGQWQAHVEHAAALLKPGGRLVAVLPSGARNKDVLPGYSCEWSETFAGEFAGTSVSVVILIARKVV